MHYYILFDNHTDAMAMYAAVKRSSRYAQISPTPRELSVCCGVSLLIHQEDIPFIREMAAAKDLRYRAIEELDNQFDSGRHRYG